MSDDPRLLERGDTSDELRTLLLSAKRDDAAPSDLASLETRLSATLPKGAFAPEAKSLATGSVAKWIAVGAGAIGLSAFGVYLASQPSPAAPVAPLAVSVASAPATAAAPIVSVPEGPTSVPSLVTVAAPVLAAPPLRSAPTAQIKPEETEEAMLARAHAQLLHGEASQALQTAAAHARAYPNGNFVQEREMIAIEALLKTGDRTAATARAGRFRKNFPGSGHLARLDTLLPAP